MDTRAVNNSSPANGLGSARSVEAKATGEARKARGSGAAEKIGELAPGEVRDFDVSLSPESKERAEAFQKAFEIAQNTPDIREDRVAELKKKIDAGTYRVDAGKIADGIMREAVRERLSQGD